MASILLSLVPIFCMLIDTIILKQRFTLIKAAAVAFSVVGVVMIVGLSEIQINPWGCGAMILSGLGWLLYNYQAKPLYSRYTGLDITTYLSACIAGVTLPLALIFPPDYRGDHHQFSVFGSISLRNGKPHLYVCPEEHPHSYGDHPRQFCTGRHHYLQCACARRDLHSASAARRGPGYRIGLPDRAAGETSGRF